MKKIGSLILFIFCFIISCKKEDVIKTQTRIVDKNITLIEGRLHFKQYEDLQEFVSKYEKYGNILKEKNFNDLNTISDNQLKYNLNNLLCPSLLKVFNSDLEYLIGDKLVKLIDNKIFMYNIENLNNISKQIKTSKPINITIISKINKVVNNKVTFTNSGLNANLQSQSNLSNGVGWRKHVFEIGSNKFPTGSSKIISGIKFYEYKTEAFLRLKLEYKGSNGWRQAGDSRIISYDINGNCIIDGEAYQFNFKNELISNQDLLFTIANPEASYSQGITKVEIDASGNISQTTNINNTNNFTYSVGPGVLW